MQADQRGSESSSPLFDEHKNMSWKHSVKMMVARLGYHLERNSENPEHTWIGLKTLPIRTIIDVGANEGQFAQRSLRQFPGAHIVCFEPLPGPSAVLSRWAQGQPRVTVYTCALGEQDAEAEMFVHSDHTPSSSFLKSTALSSQLYPFTSRQAKMIVPVKRLDDVLAEGAPLQTDILVKMDVQGFEGRVIRGGTNVLRRAKACIVEISLDTLYDGQSTFKEIFSELDALSFRYAGNLSQAYSADAHVVYLDAVFLR